MSDIATDADGYSYVVGQANDTIGFMGFPSVAGGGFLAKVSPAGSVIWSRAFTRAFFLEIELKDNVLFATGHGEGNFVVGSHSFNVDSLQHGCLVASFDTAGNDLWVDCLRFTEILSAQDIDVNDAGELFIAGSGNGAIYTATDTLYLNSIYPQAVILKYTPTGALAWITTGGCTWSETRAVGIACDEFGAAYVTGHATTYSPECEVVDFGPFTMPYPSTFFLTKVDGAGNFLWLRHAFGGMGEDVEYLGEGAIAVIGYFTDSTNAVGSSTLLSQSRDLFIGSFDLNGVPGWSYQSNTAPLPAFCYGRRLERSPQGSLFAVSHGSGSILFDGTTVNSTGSGLQVSRFSLDGTRHWTAVMQGHPATSYFKLYTRGLASDQDDRAYVAGQFIATDAPNAWLSWGTDSVAGTLGSSSLFVARTNNHITEALPEVASAEFSIYPNPTAGIIRVEGITASAKVIFTDARGRVVVPPPVGKGLFDLSGLSNGVYMVQVDDGKHGVNARVIFLH